MTKRRRRGRPRKDFDLRVVERLAAIGATADEIGTTLGADRATINRRMREDAEFCAALEKGRARAKISLRRKQWQAVMRGNITMMIWLGRQMLGQRQFDKYLPDPVPKPDALAAVPMEPLKVSDLDVLTDEELDVLEKLIASPKGTEAGGDGKPH